jgi:hypothetical protein
MAPFCIQSTAPSRRWNEALHSEFPPVHWVDVAVEDPEGTGRDVIARLKRSEAKHGQFAGRGADSRPRRFKGQGRANGNAK